MAATRVAGWSPLPRPDCAVETGRAVPFLAEPPVSFSDIRGAALTTKSAPRPARQACLRRNHFAHPVIATPHSMRGWQSHRRGGLRSIQRDRPIFQKSGHAPLEDKRGTREQPCRLPFRRRRAIISTLSRAGAVSSAVRAPRSHRGGRRFKSSIAHHPRRSEGL